MFFAIFFFLVFIFFFWSRYIEPRLITTTELTWTLKQYKTELHGLKILHISDLHFNARTPTYFLKKIERKIAAIKPDLILFTGDFICFSRLEDRERLLRFLKSMEASLGLFCIFGNHDYAHYVSKNAKGIYDVLPPSNPLRGIIRGTRILFSARPRHYSVSLRARATERHEGLLHLLEQTSFVLLENKTVTLPIGLNITGLGDLSVGQNQPEQAFTRYESQFPGIILTHNPDTFSTLLDFPGEWILAGHTHGEQIHLKWPKFLRRFSQKLTGLVHQEYSRGLYQLENDKKIYINRGLGSVTPFRFCSLPEITVIQVRSHE